MNKKSLVTLLRISIAFIGTVGLVICLFWFPFGNEYNDCSQTAKLIQQIFLQMSSIPCFIILGIGWWLTNDILKGNEFTKKSAKKFLTAFYLLFIDSCIFILGNLTFMFLGWNKILSIVYLALGVLGIILSFFAYIISFYILKAQKIKEENDSII